MAAHVWGGQYAMSASATNLTTALSLGSKKVANRITLRCKTGAANPLYYGNSDVTNTPTNAHGELAAGQSIDLWSPMGGVISSDDVYVVGTVNAANVLFVDAMS